jgi:hypothetical protein
LVYLALSRVLLVAILVALHQFLLLAP